MCELFNMAACGGADQVLISTEGMEVVVLLAVTPCLLMITTIDR